MNKRVLTDLKEINTDKIANCYYRELRNAEVPNNLRLNAIIIACILYKMQTIFNDGFRDVEDLKKYRIFPDRVEEIMNIYADDVFDVAKKLKGRFSLDELISFILFNNSAILNEPSKEQTSEALRELALSILSVLKNDKFVDICSGCGSIMLDCYMNNLTQNYTGIEISEFMNEIAEIRKLISGADGTLVLGDALEYRLEDGADKIFANYPLLTRDISQDSRDYLFNEVGLTKPCFDRASDWLFNIAIINQLNKDGRGVALISNKALHNKEDFEIRRYFIENGFVECVIGLPIGILEGFNGGVSIIVFSRGNKQIKFIDARKNFESRGKFKYLSGKSIAQITSLYENDIECAYVINRKPNELSRRDMALNISSIFDVAPEIEGGEKLEDVSLKIFRGTQSKADDLKRLMTSKKTPNRYFQVQNIEDGTINLAKQYLKEIPSKMEKYCIRDKSIVMSRFGQERFNSAVIEINDEEQVLATENIIVIEPNLNKINPYFLQAFLMSTSGCALFKSICSDNAIKVISVKDLNNSIVPCPPLSEQEKIANAYKQLTVDICDWRKALSRNIKKAMGIYDSTVN